MQSQIYPWTLDRNLFGQHRISWFEPCRLRFSHTALAARRDIVLCIFLNECRQSLSQPRFGRKSKCACVSTALVFCVPISGRALTDRPTSRPTKRPTTTPVTRTEATPAGSKPTIRIAAIRGNTLQLRLDDRHALRKPSDSHVSVMCINQGSHVNTRTVRVNPNDFNKPVTVPNLLSNTWYRCSYTLYALTPGPVQRFSQFGRTQQVSRALQWITSRVATSTAIDVKTGEPKSMT